MRTDELRILDSLAASAETHGKTVGVTPATLRELLAESRRLAYIKAHGSAWEQSVARGELDSTVQPACPRPTAPA